MEEGILKLCAECKDPVEDKKVLCLIDFVLALKEAGFENDVIRKIYRFAIERGNR